MQSIRRVGGGCSLPVITRSSLLPTLPPWIFSNTSQSKTMSKLSDEQKQAALEAGKQGMKDAYEKSKTKTGLKWWERLLWVVLAGAAYAASALLGGCGHSVDVTPKKTVVCKDGSCLVLEPGHISYSQAQPETDVPPVVQSLKK